MWMHTPTSTFPSSIKIWVIFSVQRFLLCVMKKLHKLQRSVAKIRCAGSSKGAQFKIVCEIKGAAEIPLKNKLKAICYRLHRTTQLLYLVNYWCLISTTGILHCRYKQILFDVCIMKWWVFKWLRCKPTCRNTGAFTFPLENQSTDFLCGIIIIIPSVFQHETAILNVYFIIGL